MKELRHIDQKFMCVYCGKDTSTFCGYWRLVSTEIYIGNKKEERILDQCYAHVGCFLEYHRRIIQMGITPLAKSCAKIDTTKKAYDLAKIHSSRRLLQNTVKFLRGVIKRFDNENHKSKDSN